MPPPRPEGRRALVTGGARGIGRAVVTRLLEDRFEVSATYHLTPPPTDLDAVGWHSCDVADFDSVSAVVARAGDVDVLVANAAVLRDGLSANMTDEQFLDVVQTDLGGAVSMARAVLPGMIQRRWGRIIGISSAGALLGSAGQANYITAKAALNGWVAGLAVEVAAYGVTANVVAPGPIDTELLRSMDPKRREALASVVPARRMGTPSEVAAVVAFLASESAGFVTGAVIPVDGGLSRGGLWGRSVRDHMRRRASADADADGGGDAVRSGFDDC